MLLKVLMSGFKVVSSILEHTTDAIKKKKTVNYDILIVSLSTF